MRIPISFVMPAYNCAGIITESIESILEGNFADGDELIVVNDASTDNTVSVVTDMQHRYPQICLLHHKINKGSAAAGRNTGIEQAQNDLIFCLDADNILVPQSIERLREHFAASGADVAAFGEIHFFKSSPDSVTHKWVFQPRVTLSDALAGHYWPGGSGNYLFTRASWLKAGRYDESLLGAYDSWAFAVSQLATGSTMVTLPGSYYLHRYGYDSAFVRDSQKVNESLLALRVVSKFIHLLDEKDVDHIFSRKGRYTWFKNIEKRPLRVKGQPRGTTGQLVRFDGDTGK